MRIICPIYFLCKCLDTAINIYSNRFCSIYCMLPLYRYEYTCMPVKGGFECNAFRVFITPRMINYYRCFVCVYETVHVYADDIHFFPRREQLHWPPQCKTNGPLNIIFPLVSWRADRYTENVIITCVQYCDIYLIFI